MEELSTTGFGLDREMRSSAFTPPLFDADDGSIDEKVMLFLSGRKAGDPTPANVITNVNPFSLEPWDFPASYDDDDDVEHVESMLMRFLEDEESSLSINAQNISQPVIGSDEVVQAIVDSLHNPHAYLGFPRDDYLELNDLYDPDSASSSSNNSSTISVHSNEYFNSEELLRYLGSEEHKNYNSCFSTSAKPSQPTGLIANNVYSMKRFTA